MPQRHSKLIEIALCQIGQDLSIDFALAKQGLILNSTIVYGRALAKLGTNLSGVDGLACGVAFDARLT